MGSFTGYTSALAQIGIQAIIVKPKRGFFNPMLPDGGILPDIMAHATIREHHMDRAEITDHPVEQGAAISDHMFKHPAELTLEIGWSNSPPAPTGIAGGLLAAGGILAADSPAARQVANVAGAAVGLYQGFQSLSSAINGAQLDQIKAIYQQLLRLQSDKALFTIYTGKRVYTNMVVQMLTTETTFKTENSLPITMQCRQVILVNTQTVTLPAATQADPKQTSSDTNRGQVSAKTSTDAPTVFGTSEGE